MENLEVAPGHYRISLCLPDAFGMPHPGQFIMIRETGREEPLLSRPFSVYGFRKNNDRVILDLLYRVIGRGTAFFSHLKEKASVSVLGPLGQGFTMPPSGRNVIFAAGGVGVAPLTFLLQEFRKGASGFKEAGITAYVGAKTAALLVGMDRLEGFCNLRISTDDGSSGYRGTVTDLLERDLRSYPPDTTWIYGCGPSGMIRSLSRIVRATPIRCQVSLEERMACGFGACLGCAVKTTDHQGITNYRRVCHEGPVFDILELSQI
jgi:dihydroorotate dehydrogenase electron transfer subunit